jgi:hypothetical protein
LYRRDENLRPLCRYGSHPVDQLHPSEELFMRYICLVHADPAAFDAMTTEQRADLDRRSLAYDKDLEARGHYVIAEAIQGSESATLVRVREGKMSATDGPFIETKEQMAGFVLVDARDMNEAVRLAAGIPMAELGTIEVRPIYDIPVPPEK